MGGTVRIGGFALGAGLLLLAFQAQAAIAPTLFEKCTRKDAAPLNYLFCDDGVPGFGGITPNPDGRQAVTVPAEYGGDGYTGLPPKKLPTTVRGADANGDIALDVDVSIPLLSAPDEGFPLLVFMHGCCSGNKTNWEAEAFDPAGERWHYNNAWFASRGYVVVNYTARGFATRPPNRQGSTGETQIDSRRFEVNDFQHLACQVYARANDWTAAHGGGPVRINPERVVITGGSYGGGLAWMALTDPVWQCTPDTGTEVEMRLAAAAPRYGWTDLVYSLVPTGHHRSDPGLMPDVNGCDSGPLTAEGTPCASGAPVGIPKESILLGLYGTGVLGATFPQPITEAFACLNGPYPAERNPGCAATLAKTLPEFLRDRSAYYQNDFFERIASDERYRVPVFNAATFTDPLFPPHENRRMHNRLLAVTQGQYPLQTYFGDYQHFVQNKAKEWGDLCGDDRHVCTDADYGGDFNARPASLKRIGVTTRLNRFVDHYAKPQGNRGEPAPARGALAALTVCPQKAATAQVASEPGALYGAKRYEEMSTGSLVLDSADPEAVLKAGSGRNQTFATSGGAAHADPVLVSQMSNKCPTRSVRDPIPLGVAVYESDPLQEGAVLLGAPLVSVDFAPQGDSTSLQLHARLYEVLPNGDALMISRGFRRLGAAEVAAGDTLLELFDNGWEIAPGNRLRLELTQDDTPFLKASTPPSGLTLSRVKLELPLAAPTALQSPTGPGPGRRTDAPPAGSKRSGGGALDGPVLTGLLAFGLMVSGLATRRRRRSGS